MNSLLQFILLTAVVFHFDSVAWGETAETRKAESKKSENSTGCLKADLAELNARVAAAEALQSAANSRLLSARSTQEGLGNKPGVQQALNRAEQEVQAADIEVRKAKANKNLCDEAKKECDEIKKEEAELVDKFPYNAQVKAMTCLAEDRNEDNDSGNGVTVAILEQLGGRTSESVKKTCRVDSNKDYREQFEKREKERDTREKEIFDVDKEMISDEKEFAKSLKRLQDERLDLKEDFEKKQSDKGVREDRALKAMRENQMKIQEQVRRSNAELINARQELAKVDRKRNEELAKNGLQDLASITRTCNKVVADYRKGDEKFKAKVRGSGGSAFGAAKNNGQDVIAVYNTCLKNAESRRAAIYQDTENYQIQKMNEVRDREQQLADFEKEFKQQFDDYQKAIQREGDNLNKAYAAYLEKDQAIGKAINDLQVAAMKERQSNEQKKEKASKKYHAALASEGELGDDEATTLMTQSEKYSSLLQQKEDNKCPGWEDAKSRKKNLDALRTNANKAIDSRKANQ